MHGAARGGPHPRPVRARHAYIAHAALDLPLQGFEQRRVDDSIDFDVLVGFETKLFLLRGGAALLQVEQQT